MSSQSFGVMVANTPGVEEGIIYILKYSYFTQGLCVLRHFLQPERSTPSEKEKATIIYILPANPTHTLHTANISSGERPLNTIFQLFCQFTSRKENQKSLSNKVTCPWNPIQQQCKESLWHSAKELRINLAFEDVFCHHSATEAHYWTIGGSHILHEGTGGE